MRHSPFLRSLQTTLPFSVTLVLILLGVALTPEALRMVTPPLLFPCLFFWAALYPAGLPVLLVFMLGLVSDILMGLPLGAMPLLACLLYWLAGREEHLRRRGFKALWITFAWQGALTMLAMFFALSLYQWRWMALPPVLVQTLLMLAVYPAVHWLMMRLMKALRIERDGG